MSTYLVTADIEFVDGGLAGLPIPKGFYCTYPGSLSANLTADWINMCFAAETKIKATGTTCHYLFKSEATVEKLDILF